MGVWFCGVVDVWVVASLGRPNQLSREKLLGCFENLFFNAKRMARKGYSKTKKRNGILT